MKPKAIIEIEGEEGDITLTITFDPPPPLLKEGKEKASLVASLAIEMIQHYNNYSVMSEGGVLWQRLRMPQLNKEYTKKELDESLIKSMEESVRSIKSIINPSEGEHDNAKTIQPKRALH